MNTGDRKVADLCCCGGSIDHSHPKCDICVALYRMCQLLLQPFCTCKATSAFTREKCTVASKMFIASAPTSSRRPEMYAHTFGNLNLSQAEICEVHKEGGGTEALTKMGVRLLLSFSFILNISWGFQRRHKVKNPQTNEGPDLCFGGRQTCLTEVAFIYSLEKKLFDAQMLWCYTVLIKVGHHVAYQGAGGEGGTAERIGGGWENVLREACWWSRHKFPHPTTGEKAEEAIKINKGREARRRRGQAHCTDSLRVKSVGGNGKREGSKSRISLLSDSQCIWGLIWLNSLRILT